MIFFSLIGISFSTFSNRHSCLYIFQFFLISFYGANEEDFFGKNQDAKIEICHQFSEPKSYSQKCERTTNVIDNILHVLCHKSCQTIEKLVYSFNNIFKKVSKEKCANFLLACSYNHQVSTKMLEKL